jgi:pyruvate dehydrogenase E2 component (dihydrolipoamide acetyltransferase)
MAEFRMPSLGADMDRGTLLEWRVAPGDTVTRGDIIAVIDTDKSDIEVEVFETGIVDELLVSEGTEVAVGTPLARIATTGPVPAPVGAEAPDARPTLSDPASAPTKAEAPSPTDVSAPPDAPAPSPGAADAPAGRPTPWASTPVAHPNVFSPLVRHRADELGVDLTTVTGTGPEGAITRADVEQGAGSPPPPGEQATHSSPYARRLAAEAGIDLADVTGTGPDGAVVAADIEHTRAASTSRPDSSPDSTPGPAPGPAPGAARPTRQQSIRRSVARLMARSKREIPHYYLSTTIDLAPATAWLATTNAERSVTDRILPAALLLKATAVAAGQVPEMNGHWVDDAFVAAEQVDLGVAVSLRGGGLVAPAIRSADELTIDELMSRLRDLVTRARTGRLTSSEMTDPSLTVTNLGDQGVEAVFGVIYPPQVALVGFGKIVERPWAAGGMLGIHPCVTATLSADHRASDGHRGATLLATIDRLLADPGAL